jgi:uncharacterized protein YjbI with pentapeptide repeats
MKIQIKNRFDDSVIFEHDVEENSICITVVAALAAKCSLSNADLRNADLSNADLSNADLRNADLSNADLSNADLSNADLGNADLSNAYLSNADLSNAYLSNADLRNADLSNADLSNAYLSNADLRNAYLRNADLRNAYLRNADLSNAYLSNADLSNADLRNAYLRNAYLRNAVLGGVNLEGVNLEGADLTVFKRDLFALLVVAMPEIQALRNAIVVGQIDGSTYEGECACLCGTLEKSRDPLLVKRVYDLRDSYRPIERLFGCISSGDTPETNAVSKIVLEWVDEFQALVSAQLPPPVL